MEKLTLPKEAKDIVITKLTRAETKATSDAKKKITFTEKEW